MTTASDLAEFRLRFAHVLIALGFAHIPILFGAALALGKDPFSIAVAGLICALIPLLLQRAGRSIETVAFASFSSPRHPSWCSPSPATPGRWKCISTISPYWR
jgi:hypothetical protein